MEPTVREKYKVVLVGPPILKRTALPSLRQFKPYVPPLGILCLAGALREQDIRVAVIDPNLFPPVSTHSSMQDVYSDLASHILSLRPQIVGLSTVASTYIDTIMLAKQLRQHAEDLVLVLGGPQSASVAKSTLQHFDWIDIIVRGEGEATLVQLVKELQQGWDVHNVSGITYRRKGDVVSTRDRPLIDNADALPIPAYDLLDFSEYSRGTKIPVDNGRGCPYACRFCNTAVFWKRQVRMKSVERLIDEIRYVRSFDCTRSLGFVHDLFWINDKYVRTLCQGIIKSGLDVSWRTYARVDAVNPLLLGHCHEAGCEELFFGVESGSDRIRKNLGKHFSTDSVLRIVEATMGAGIQAVVGLMIGIPGETIQDLQRTIDLQNVFEAMGAKVRVSIYTPLPGSPLFDALGELVPDDFSAPLFYAEEGLPFEAQLLIKRFPKLFSAHYTPAMDSHLRQQVILFKAVHDLLNYTDIRENAPRHYGEPNTIRETIRTGRFRDVLRYADSLRAFLDGELGADLRMELVHRLRREGTEPASFFAAWLRGVQFQTNAEDSHRPPAEPLA